MTVSKLEAMTKEYMDQLSKLNTISAKVRAKIKKATDQHIGELNGTLDEMKKLEAEIRAETKANKHLFKRPKTRVLNGVKIGFRKGKGKLVVDDEEKCIEKIKRDYHDDIGALIKREETLVMSGLEKLDAKELKRLGVTIVSAGDNVVFGICENDIDEFINFLFEVNN